ncbi:transporter [Thermococcus sp. SY098]|uniref:transporter n=1 Tax=Thermococcus sp. SY098 TaxID=3111325 RepID=UPI002D79F93D|nr:transporter [Thermococcus sp. SY098]WRS51840.1 transporter [Thermococcus sp. SY098]
MKRVKADLLWLLLIAFIVNFAVIHGRKFPVGGTGGDTLIHMAMIRGIYLGRNPFLDQHYNVFPNWYPFLYHILIAFLAKITRYSIWDLMIWTPLVFSVFMTYAWYKLGESLNEEYGGLVLGSLSFLILKRHLFPNPKELITIFLPLFYLELLNSQRYKSSRRYTLLAGMILGLTLLTHSLAIALLSSVLIYGLLKTDRKLLKVATLGLIISLPFYVNIIINKEVTPKAIEDIYFHEQTDTIFTKLRGIVPSLYFVPLWLFGLYSMYRGKDKDKNSEIVLAMMLGISISIIFPELLKSFKIFIFSRRFFIPLKYTYLIVYFYGIQSILSYLPKSLPKKVFALLFSFIFIIYGSITFIEYNYSSYYSLSTYHNFEELTLLGLQNYSKGVIKVSEWLIQNSKRDDYLIGHPLTIGEYIAAFTGRPVVAVTYGHGNPFLDMRRRRIDTEEFFMTPSKRKEIIQKYGIKYVILCPLTQKYYNVTVENFERDEFRIVFQWDEFYILETKK